MSDISIYGLLGFLFLIHSSTRFSSFNLLDIIVNNIVQNYCKHYNYHNYFKQILYLCEKHTMENFYLVLIKKDGEIIHNTFATSHDNLIDKYIIPNDIPYSNFFRAKFRPKDELSLVNVDEYKLLIQETFIPEWFDDEFRINTINKLRNIIKSMIITTHKNLLLNEGVILSKTAKIDKVMNCIVYAMYDSSNVKSLCCNSQVLLVSDECIIDKTEDNSRIEEMYGNALVNEMYGYSKIMKMHGNTKVLKMYNN